jgi:protoheme ferro-lyase
VQFVPWASALIASAVAGAFACRAVVARRQAVLPLSVAALFASFAAVASCVAVLSTTSRIDKLIAVVAISIGAMAGGYALAAAMLASHPKRGTAPMALVVGPSTPGTYVLLLSDEEPEEYDPAAVAIGLERYEDGDTELPPEIARPLIYASERARFHRTGGSPARGAVRAVAASLESRLAAGDLAVSVTAAFCVGPHTLDCAVAEVVAAGGRHIVVAPLAAAWSKAFTDSVERLPASALESAGVCVEKAEPLWSSPRLSAMVASRALSLSDEDHADDGFVLLSEGDPWEQARGHETYREQLTFMIQRVRAELIRAGTAPDRIRRAWLWLEEPDVAEAVRHLVALGARNVVLVPATFPTETVATLTDVPYAAERAAAETGAQVSVVAPWGDDPAVVDSLVESVTAAIDHAKWS